MFISVKIVRKFILSLVVMAVFFWAVVLPAHFPHKRTIEDSCQCLTHKSTSQTNAISISLVDLDDPGSRCPLCVLSSMFSLALIIEENSSIANKLNEDTLPTILTSYSIKIFENLRARAPPKVFYS